MKLERKLLFRFIQVEVADLVLNKPKTAEKEFQEVFVKIIQTFKSKSLSSDPLVVCVLRVDALPPGSCSGRLNYIHVLYSYICKITAMTEPVSCIRAGWYKCQLCEWRSYLFKSPKNCPSCTSYSPLEDVTRRVRGVEVHLSVTNDLAFHTMMTDSKVYHPMAILCKDEICEELEVGLTYNFVLYQGKAGIVQSWGHELYMPDPVRRSLLKLDPPSLPKSVIELFDSVRNWSELERSPWALVTRLSCELDPGRFPPTSFLHLKTALLLSLASHSWMECGVSVLSLGSDSSAIMTAALDLCCSYCPTTPLIGRSSSTSQASKPAVALAPPLALASNKTCYIGNLNKFNSSFTTDLLQSIDSETVTLIHHGKEASVAKLPLRTKVWTHWDCDKSSLKDISQLRTLINIFGLPFLGYACGDDEQISQFLLMKAMIHHQELPSVPRNDLKKFIQILSLKEVELTPMASNLIKRYFAASRQDRPDGLPACSIKTITRLSKGHARLSLKNTVTHEDVIVVIYLYEEVMSLLHGPSVYAPPLSREYQSSDPLEVTLAIDSILREFSLWLDQYVKICAGLSANSSEFLS